MLNGGGEDGGGETLLETTFPARAGQLKHVRGAVTDAIRRCGFDKDVAADVVLAVDEACQNIIRHAYKDVDDGEIVLRIWRESGRIVVLLRDFADPVDTSRIRPRDLDDLRPGGLGTHFMNAVMDEVVFLPPPADTGNLLRMTKKVA